MSHVTITDPHHPLAGQRFPLVALCAPQGPHKLVIALPDGRHRAVRRSLTDLDPAAPVPLSDALGGPRLGARSLLLLAQCVRNMLASQEIPDVPAPAAAPFAPHTAPASTLAADVPCPTTAISTAMGTATPTDTALRREGEGAC
ncbi:MAG: hypothetical protein JOZ45_15310 [Acidobacteriaceae bacterium]|nr:hypothetical protein [Acidobacteriaceae bacterium]